MRINNKNGMRTLPWRLVGKLTKEELFPPVDMDTSDLHTQDYMGIAKTSIIKGLEY